MTALLAAVLVAAPVVVAPAAPAAPLPSTYEIGLVEGQSAPEEYVFRFEGPKTLSFCPSRHTSLDAVVRDSAGQVVRTLLDDVPHFATSCIDHPHNRLTWDLRDDAGQPVPDGTYAVELVGVEIAGSEVPAPTASRTVEWHVTDRVPGVFTKPVPGDVLVGRSTFEFVPTPGFAAEFSVFVQGWCGTVIDAIIVPADATLVTGTFDASCGGGFMAFVYDPLGKLHFHEVTIQVAVQAPRLDFSTVHVAEGDDGSVVADLAVVLSQAVVRDLTFGYQTTTGSATPGGDFEEVTGSVTVPAGATEASVPITVHADDEAEGDELVLVYIWSNEGVPVGGLFGYGFVVIEDDDAGPIARPGAASVVEGGAGSTTLLEVPVTLSEPSPDEVRVDWRTVRNSATPGSDYTAASGTLTFAPGQTEAIVSVEVHGDDVNESDELVPVALGYAEGARVGGWLGIGSGVIVDDDG